MSAAPLCETAMYSITPVPKPRQTQRDKWAKRPAVLRYRAFADEVRLQGIHVPPDGCHITFWLPMPASWSKRKRADMAGKPHTQKPDIDNLAKALLDAVHQDDAGVWRISAEKRWAFLGAIEVTT